MNCSDRGLSVIKLLTSSGILLYAEDDKKFSGGSL